MTNSDVVAKVQAVGNCRKTTQLFVKLIVRGKMIEQGPWMSDDVKGLMLSFLLSVVMKPRSYFSKFLSFR